MKYLFNYLITCLITYYTVNLVLEGMLLVIVYCQQSKQVFNCIINSFRFFNCELKGKQLTVRKLYYCLLFNLQLKDQIALCQVQGLTQPPSNFICRKSKIEDFIIQIFVLPNADVDVVLVVSQLSYLLFSVEWVWHEMMNYALMVCWWLSYKVLYWYIRHCSLLPITLAGGVGTRSVFCVGLLRVCDDSARCCRILQRFT